jgi:hypothetical protein
MTLHIAPSEEAQAALLALLERAEIARLHRAVLGRDGHLLWPGGAAKLLAEHIAALSSADFRSTPETEELLGALVSMRAALVRWYGEEAPKRQERWRSLFGGSSLTTLSGSGGPSGEPSGSGESQDSTKST